MIDLGNLNPQQREAVTYGDGPLLVLAGAGSGKTRVITYRLGYLIGERQVPASSILAVTFTNKAASEMLTRIMSLIPASGGQRPVIGTFHSTSLRMLRRYADHLGYTKSFSIYDTADQLTLVRRVMRELSLSDATFPPRRILSAISRAKNELIGPAEYERTAREYFEGRVSEAYRLYQKRLREFDAMDFDDLIGQYVHLLSTYPEIRDEIRTRHAYLLIDEYQDTNRAQYQLIKQLAGERGNVTAVGDEDQSIYRFRGADIQNILNFERDFPGAKVVKLEQNYRSSGNILGAASGVVARNVARKGKTLFTAAGAGDLVRVITCETEREEAKYVLGKIVELRPRHPLSEFAVLFRTNAQSRPFEEELLAANLPYVVVGGVKFYERAEVKDILAFLRIAVRPHDTPSIERVINVPARGIGDTTLEALDAEAKRQDATLWTVIEGDLGFLTERAKKAVREFREIVHDLQRAAANPLPQIFDYILLRTGYRRMLTESKDPQDESRLQNLEELSNSAREFHEANSFGTVGDYLDSVTLLSDVDQYDAEKGITLMTLHAAKGLEFEVVFLAGLEEGILPHSQSRQDDADVEEERRLCYVGMTRARAQLYCLTCLQRRIHGQFREQNRSQFLDEIPKDVREEIRLAGTPQSSRTAPQRPSWRERPIESSSRGRRDEGTSVYSFFKDSPVRFDPEAIKAAKSTAGSQARELVRGARVRHELFGDGVILRMEGSGADAKLTVYFDRVGTKKFIARFAKLTRI